MNTTFPLQDKTILVTGGTGSFGKVFIKKALTEHSPRKVIVFSRDELKQWEMRQNDPVFDHDKIRYFLGDVRDKDRLERAFRDVDLVVHAAALKQVPAAEYNPTEFIKTNIHGAMNVIDAAIDRGVEKVIALSTDKAANPINLYGATKLCSDKLFVAGNAYVGAKGFPKFSVVRYGNVIGSRGSIIPRWQSMIAEGAKELPVTDPRMTRFWITLEQAADFVISNFGHMLGGEIFVPKIPSMKLIDLVKALSPTIGTKIIGIRPGEKLHELMIGEDDARHTAEFPEYFAIAPEAVHSPSMAAMERLLMVGGKRVADGFTFASDTNKKWLGPADIAQIIKSGGVVEASRESHGKNG
jgi:UDP-N-acetylglucosamine 4,6-dehydratase/5-epimerase